MFQLHFEWEAPILRRQLGPTSLDEIFHFEMILAKMSGHYNFASLTHFLQAPCKNFAC